jgi:CO dehydrogenase maturation factor
LPAHKGNKQMSKPSIKRNNRILAVCGKGGTGKTVFTALMAKVLLDSGKAGKLLLIDADPAMGLPLALGVKVRRTMGQIREEIIKAAKGNKEEEKRQIADKLDYMLFEALNEIDSYALLAMGRTETLGCFCPINSVLKEAIQTLSKSFDTILIDGEAGLEQLNRQVAGRVDTLVIVSDATSRGIQTAAQVRDMVLNEKAIQCDRLGIVFNRVQGNKDLLKKMADKTGLEVWGYIPQDENIAQQDLIGKPILELRSSQGLEAVREIVEKHLFAELFA